VSARAQYGSGGGIVWDSTPEREWAEACDKMRVLTHRRPTFRLLETLRWTPARGYALLRAHLARLRASAEYFDYRYSGRAVRRALARAVARARSPRRVRLTLGEIGDVRVEIGSLPATPPCLRLGLARRPVHSEDVRLHHKTTDRTPYDRARAERPDCDDVVLFNERGEITETTIANLVVQLGRQRLTPAASCGLLPGTLRSVLLARGEIHEAILHAEDLRRADRIWLINSLRGWVPATLCD